MKSVYKVAGIDVHKKMLAVVVSDVSEPGEHRFEQRSFGTGNGELGQLADWLVGVRDGVLVRQVLRNTPAEKAGLKAGDVITKVGGANVGSTREITSQLRSAARTNRAVTLTLVREKHEMTLTVTLDQAASPATPPDPAAPARF